MTPNPVTAKHNSSLDDLISIMQEAKVRRLPIIDDRNHLVGFVSFDDLLEKARLEISSLSQLSQNQQEYERETRPTRAKLFKSLGS
jgi:CBS-domain-containing membrane protein